MLEKSLDDLRSVKVETPVLADLRAFRKNRPKASRMQASRMQASRMQSMRANPYTEGSRSPLPPQPSPGNLLVPPQQNLSIQQSPTGAALPPITFTFSDPAEEATGVSRLTRAVKKDGQSPRLIAEKSRGQKALGGSMCNSFDHRKSEAGLVEPKILSPAGGTLPVIQVTGRPGFSKRGSMATGGGPVMNTITSESVEDIGAQAEL